MPDECCFIGVSRNFPLRQRLRSHRTFLDFSLAHPKNGSIQEHILPTREFGVKRYLLPAGLATRPSMVIFPDVGSVMRLKIFQRGRFSRTVPSDDANPVPLHDVKVNVLERPKLFMCVIVLWCDKGWVTLWAKRGTICPRDIRNAK